jgi:bifunctional non-homologous end joining protein LigD
MHRALPPVSGRQAPSGANWIHEIKHDGYRLMARSRRDPVGIRLITRRDNHWTTRYPLVVEAVNHLKVRSCLIDGEVVCCDEKGVAAFQLLQHRRNEPQAFLFAFDLLPAPGADRGAQGNAGQLSCRRGERRHHPPCAPCAHSGALRGGPCAGRRLGSRYRSGRSPDWLKFKNPEAPAVRREAEEDWR